TGLKMLADKKDEEELNPEENPFLKFAKRFLRFTNQNHEGKFAIRENGQLLFTPLFMVIILIESTDLIFAIDSIPAVFAITQNEFVVYTSNIFAVMGLRAMFFLLSDIIDKFHYLQKGLAFVLMFIGAKMLIHMLNEPWLQSLFGYQLTKEIKIPISLSLGVILGLLVGSVIFSLLFPSKSQKEIKQS
ncbi:MAG: tellurium resistance protein TerC, partial [Bacteroidia bacterium]|nr:tellurium resistance protein TerC [Bacteroidia bacterium]